MTTVGFALRRAVGCTGWLCLLILELSGDGPHALGGQPTPLRGCREFWVVDTRDAPLCTGLDRGINSVNFWQDEPGRGLVRKSLGEFVSGMDPSLPTTFFVHGNWANRRSALREGRRVVETAARDVPAYRFVFWSWPTEHIWFVGLPNNALYKDGWSESQGYYLAWLIDKIDPRTPLTLAGHSFGARSVASALEALATNRTAGYDLGPRHFVGSRPMQAALIAAAFDNRWLWPGWRYGDALGQVDRMLVTRSPGDRVLRMYSWELLPAGVSALGLTGVPRAAWRLGDQRSKLIEIDAAWAGNAHWYTRYLSRPEAVLRLRPFLFYEVAPAGETREFEELQTEP